MTVCQPLSRPFVNHGVGISGAIKAPMSTNDAKAIGKAVKAARTRRGWTQQRLADEVGKSLDSVKRIEAGDRVEQWVVCAHFASTLGVSPSELLGFPVASPDSLGMALQPILAAYGANPDDAESIARILLEAVEAAQSLPNDGPAELRYKIAGQIAAARSRG